MSFTEVKIKIPDWTWGWEWRHAPEACVEDFSGFEKSQLAELRTRLRTGRVDFRSLAEALCRVRMFFLGGRWKSHHRKIVHLSSLCRKTFNSKVIKDFVPELRSRYVFFVFRDSNVLCIYVMNILCTFHISVSWVWYMWSLRSLVSIIFFYFFCSQLATHLEYFLYSGVTYMFDHLKIFDISWK